jgi:hypothetical protein
MRSHGIGWERRRPGEDAAALPPAPQGGRTARADEDAQTGGCEPVRAQVVNWAASVRFPPMARFVCKRRFQSGETRSRRRPGRRRGAAGPVRRPPPDGRKRGRPFRGTVGGRSSLGGAVPWEDGTDTSNPFRPGRRRGAAGVSSGPLFLGSAAAARSRLVAAFVGLKMAVMLRMHNNAFEQCRHAASTWKVSRPAGTGPTPGAW